MGDIIRLLPESVANQIAAGEVVQRPASAVKELLENAIDAGSTEITLIVKEAGKSLIQVADNGCGMSERDARMSFERHATSKIKSANDLLAIRTLGFRGEALASIASIAQVELQTKRTEDETGTLVQVNGSVFQSQSAVSCKNGTSVTVKNLFYNVPARRNFLKSNTLELKYIMEEFNRVALVHPDISFRLYNQGKLVLQLSPSNLKQRLVALLGTSYNHRLIPVTQETQLVNLSGFIGKPDYAKKTRGEQYFFTNGRFIKNPYLNHAVENAYQELIPRDAFPTYFIYLEVDPKTIDVNIHPTKTEINFQDARSIYAILNSAVKQSIGRFNLTPSLDFETEPSMNLPPVPEGRPISQPTIQIDPAYNPFEKQTKPQLELPYRNAAGPGGNHWGKLYDPLKYIHPGKDQPGVQAAVESFLPQEEPAEKGMTGFQIDNTYLVAAITDGIVIIDQQAAHQRILYETFLRKGEQQPITAQHLLLPQTIQVTPDDAEMLGDLTDLMKKAGLEISGFGPNTFLVHAAPPGIESSDIQPLIEAILESCKTETEDFRQKGEEKLARTMARKLSIKHGDPLTRHEVESLIRELLNTSAPELSPDGKPTMFQLSFEELAKKFKHTT